MKTTLVIPDQMHARLELQSRRNGMNVSEIIRAAIDFHLNYQDSFYLGEALKPLEGVGDVHQGHVEPFDSIPASEPLQSAFVTGLQIRDSKPLPAQLSPFPVVSPEERQARIARMVASGDKPALAKAKA